MAAYCRSCFRDTPSDVTRCGECARSAMTSRSWYAVGFLSFALVVAGMLVPDLRLCILGAAISIVALAMHLVRVLRQSR